MVGRFSTCVGNRGPGPRVRLVAVRAWNLSKIAHKSATSNTTPTRNFLARPSITPCSRRSNPRARFPRPHKPVFYLPAYLRPTLRLRDDPAAISARCARLYFDVVPCLLRPPFVAHQEGERINRQPSEGQIGEVFPTCAGMLTMRKRLFRRQTITLPVSASSPLRALPRIFRQCVAVAFESSSHVAHRFISFAQAVPCIRRLWIQCHHKLKDFHSISLTVRAEGVISPLV
jgi:hypothetical protein